VQLPIRGELAHFHEDPALGHERVHQRANAPRVGLSCRLGRSAVRKRADEKRRFWKIGHLASKVGIALARRLHQLCERTVLIKRPPFGGHVTARFRGGLSTSDFLVPVNWVQYSPEGLAQLAPVVDALAEAEDLPAHARAVRVRLGEEGGAA
jgi:hypothetical protein